MLMLAAVELYELTFWWLSLFGLLFVTVRHWQAPRAMPYCGHCRYDISESTSLRCTECGSDLRDAGILTRTSHSIIRHPSIVIVITAAIVGLVTGVLAAFAFRGNVFLLLAPIGACLTLALGHFWIMRRTIAHPPNCAHCAHPVTDPSQTACAKCKSDLRQVGIVSPRLYAKYSWHPIGHQAGMGWLVGGIILASMMYPAIFPAVFGPVQSTTLHLFSSNPTSGAAPDSFGFLPTYEQPLHPWTRTPAGEAKFVEARLILQHLWIEVSRDGAWSVFPRSSYSPFSRAVTDPEHTIHDPDAPRQWLQLLNIPHDTPEADAFVETIYAVIASEFPDWFSQSTEATPELPDRIGEWHNRRLDAYTSIRPRMILFHSLRLAIISGGTLVAWYILMILFFRHYRRRLKALTLAPPPDKAETNISP